MATEKDISSTEKLLEVIRGDSRKNNSADSAFPHSSEVNKKSPQKKRSSIMSFGSRDVVGVEIRDDRLNLVKMSWSGGAWQALQAFSASMKEGQNLHSPDFPDFLRTQLSSIHGIKKARIWTMVRASSGKIWHVNVPRVKKDLYNAVYWSARKERSFEENSTAFDFRILGETTDNGSRKHVAEVYTAPGEDVRLLKKLFSRAGFSLEGITLPSFAVQNFFVNKWFEPGTEPCAVLKIEHDCSVVDIYKENRILLSRHIKTGLESMVESLQQNYPGTKSKFLFNEDQTTNKQQGVLSRDQAAHLIAQLEENQDLFNHDKGLENNSAGEIFSMITPALERLARQVERTMDYFVYSLNHQYPSRLYVCGYLAGVPMFTSFLEKELELDIRLLDPLDPSTSKVSPLISSLNRSTRMNLSQAFGLAMSTRVNTPNFLYTALDREKEKASRRISGFAAAAMILILLFTGAYWYHVRHNLHQVREKVTFLDHQLQSRTPLVTSEMINETAGQLHKEAAALRNYSRKFVPVAVISELTSSTPVNVRLLNVRLDMGRSGDGASAGRNRTVVVDGIIRGEESLFETYLASYLLRIRSSPLFADTVIHKSETEEFGSEGRVLRFIININLEQV